MNQTPTSNSSETSARSRYPGTRPFTDSPADQALFFGRTEASEELYLRVLSVKLLVQFAKSGLGKTSLLQASLFPRLRQKPFLPVMVRLNVANETLNNAVARSLEEACRAEGLELPEGDTTGGLWELLSTTRFWRGEFLLTPVLVLDQFEEVFTLHDAKFRDELASELGALTTSVPPERLSSIGGRSSEGSARAPDVKIILSLREEYLGALEEFSVAIPGLFRERLRLKPLREAEAREAITRPAQLVSKPGEIPFFSPRFMFDPSALNSMIDFLKGKAGIIEPFELQLLCRRAEAIASKNAGAPDKTVEITLDDFRGGRVFDSVLENFYRETLTKLPLSQRKRAEELCEHGLLDAEGHRLPLEEKQIRRHYGLAAEPLASLVQDRLLRQEPRLDGVFYEISHDQRKRPVRTVG